MTNKSKFLIVIAGPTAVGKTAVAIELAQILNTEIISADSRQFYLEPSIGTAKPDFEQLCKVPHHFIGQLSVRDYYNVSLFENQVLLKLAQLFDKKNTVLMVGGSGLYIDAVCNGIDDFPDPSPDLRKELKATFEQKGLIKLQEMLEQIDPEYYNEVDRSNPNRILRALEVCLTTGRKFSELRLNNKKVRDFQVIKIGLNLPRQVLFARINNRVDDMMNSGLLQEVRSLSAYRNENALNTVGYKELFEYLDNTVTLNQAVENIKTNTRRYAKRQLTWFNRTTDYTWFEPSDLNEIASYIINKCK